MCITESLWSTQSSERKWSGSVVSDSLRPMDCSPLASSVHGILQARMGCRFLLRGSSRPRDLTQVSCIAGGFFTIWATRELHTHTHTHTTHIYIYNPCMYFYTWMNVNRMHTQTFLKPSASGGWVAATFRKCHLTASSQFPPPASSPIPEAGPLSAPLSQHVSSGISYKWTFRLALIPAWLLSLNNYLRFFSPMWWLYQ